MQYDKPQINADERRLIDVSDNVVVADFDGSNSICEEFVKYSKPQMNAD